MTNRNADSVNAQGVLILPCSGAANVGALADMAARRMARSGVGKMHCLAGVGGNVPAIMATILSAPRLLAIDGCEMHCAKETLIRAAVPVGFHLCLADLGMEKGTAVSLENIDQVVAEATDMLGR